MNIKILYEDNHLLVVEKPINMLSQADQTGDLDMVTSLKLDLKERYQKPGNVYLGLVHRLDRPVGGVMVFAKTSKAAGRLSKQIRMRELVKTYLAVVHGTFQRPQGKYVHHLVKNRHKNIVSAVSNDVKQSKEAILDYQVLASKQGYSLVKINLETGRSHQIRVQFANENHPLVGDQKYGRNNQHDQGVQIALWSYQLGFTHPVTKEVLEFISLPHGKYPWYLFEVSKIVR